MTEIHWKSILVQVSARFELVRVQVIGSQLYFLSFFISQPFSKCDCPWLIKWILGYREFYDDDKDRENMDSKIKEYLQGMYGHGNSFMNDLFNFGNHFGWKFSSYIGIHNNNN